MYKRWGYYSTGYLAFRQVSCNLRQKANRLLLLTHCTPVFEKSENKSHRLLWEDIKKDIESERVIIETIKAGFPGHNIVSEECGLVNNGSEFTWVVDPLDGTSNFAAGIPWFGVLIAVLKGEVPVMGGAFRRGNNTLQFFRR